MAIGINYTIRDSKNAKSTSTVWLPDGLTLAEAIGWAEASALLLDELITGVIDRIGINIEVDVPAGAKDTPLTVNTDVEEGARFVFGTLNGYNTSTRLATFNEAFIQPNSRIVDQTATEVAAWVEAIVTGIDVGGNTIGAVDYRDDPVAGLLTALEAFQRSRK